MIEIGSAWAKTFHVLQKAATVVAQRGDDAAFDGVMVTSRDGNWLAWTVALL